MSGPPYLAPVAMPGLVPTKSTDIPIASILLVFFVGFLISNILIMRQNNRAKTPFAFTVLLIVYSVLRTAGMSLRIAYASITNDVNLTIAAMVLANAGGILIFILNLLVMPRLVRAFWGPERTDAVAWRKKLSTLPFMIPIPLVPIFLLVVVNVLILSFFTTDPDVRRHCQTAQKVALVTFTVVAFVPVLPSLAIAILGSSKAPQDLAVRHRRGVVGTILDPAPGFGSVRGNALLILFGSSLVTLGSSIRAAGLLLPPRMANDPAWYHKRAAYYIFTFAVEILVVLAYIVFRLDRRFQEPAVLEAKDKQPLDSPTSAEMPSREGTLMGDKEERGGKQSDVAQAV
ncbi:hypothetical protein F5X68DRAFT_214836 [Plectosphaerella plurivora]|uniref:Uncharacterized protein n=1 Tax=Plectosphaerella plurivora TaxID=936078 RepID=A0A9P8V5C4_9PEZI|nr:hypothetical protein F5X68DRAFT_214836 [Plectosphaerella plurivora]